MNILPLVLFAVLLGGDKLYSIKEFLSKIDFPSFAPVLKMIGLNGNIVDFLCSEKFSEILSSDGDLKSILPVLSGLFAKKDDQNNAQETDETPKKNDYLSAIKNVAPTDIEETLSEFLN
ncbi:MAG: hypothetical protein IJW64_01355 [Clostridia bacterium]|nr:hypothetical protein [Clostridia bacterium]